MGENSDPPFDFPLKNSGSLRVAKSVLRSALIYKKKFKKRGNCLKGGDRF
jgi:hypothetical protein